MRAWCFSMRYDALVVGAGVSGMTSALRLAAEGLSVAVVEAGACVAPTIRGFWREGVYFDTGFHYTGLLGREELLGRLLGQVGVWDKLTCVPAADGEGDCLQCNEPAFSLRFRQQWDENQALLAATFPAERAGLDLYFRTIRGYWEQVPEAVLRGELGPLELANDIGGTALLTFLRSHISDPRLIAALCAHGMLYGAPAEHTSLLYHSMVAGSYYGRLYQIAGGGSALAGAYEKALAEAGVRVYTQCRVTAVTLSEDGKVRGVEVENGAEHFEANTCVFSGDPRLLLDLLPDSVFRPIYRRRLREMHDTMSAFILFGVLPEGGALPGGNQILLEDLTPGLGDVTRALDARPLFVVTSRAREGQGGISVICPMLIDESPPRNEARTGNGRGAYAPWKEGIAERLRQRLARRGGSAFNGFRTLEMATPFTFRRYCHSVAGALYGVQHRVGDIPLMPRTRVHGLYLTGQGTLATGVLGAVMSGYVSADAVLARGGQEGPNS